ncbi:olfactory receptor 11H7-like [Oncorhynchus tshawytscha]|uniref:olfactory receptor 11H7-like n=1 Tax=Oncorhynchus tshawytscha TaxID=74940 RepID=UPI000D09B396|nr:olfactory receptor 11H7-like [Oncorhynchus tshawytscha]
MVEMFFQPLEFNVSLFSDVLLDGRELGLKEIYTELAIFLLLVYIMFVIGNNMIVTLVIITPNFSRFLQMHTYLTFQTTEGFILCAVTYDCYVAICNRLRHNSIMTIKVHVPGLNNMGFQH